MELAGFSVRDVILLLLAAAAIYLVFLLLRLAQLGRQAKGQSGQLEPPLVTRAEESSQKTIRDNIDSPQLQQEGWQATTPATAHGIPGGAIFDWKEVKGQLGTAKASQPTHAPLAQREHRGGGFGEHLAEHLAKVDLEMEIQRMRDEMERMRQEMEELRAAQRVSPQYAEAMELAQRGLSAQDVADRLGISLAEAELVQALARGRHEFDEGENHGANADAEEFWESGSSSRG